MHHKKGDRQARTLAHALRGGRVDRSARRGRGQLHVHARLVAEDEGVVDVDLLPALGLADVVLLVNHGKHKLGLSQGHLLAKAGPGAGVCARPASGRSEAS